LVIHMIRTEKIPFLQSHASLPVTVLTFMGIGFLTVIPFTSIGRLLGFVALPPIYFMYLFGMVIMYIVLVTVVKKMYVRHFKELL
ncbi:MAG: hypothetical protein RR728_03900, partial [Oscillospiraceae bacterium]